MAKYLDKAKKSGMYFEPGDPLDLPKAILYGVAHSEPGSVKTVSQRMERFRADKQKWNENAEKLLEAMGMEEKTLYTTDDLKKLAKHYSGHHFALYNREKTENVYKTSFSTGDEEGNRVNLMVFQCSYAWFNPTRENTGLIACKFCRETYKKQIRHACKNCCPKCRFPLKECARSQLGYSKVCGTCHRMFFSEICFQNHQKKFKKREAACGVFQKCLKCEKQINTRNADHECGIEYCYTCHGMKSLDHQCCWIPPTEKTIERLREKEKEFKLVIFDCETIQTKTRDDITSFADQHYVCFLYWSLLCNVCINFEDSFNAECENCGDEKQGYFRHYKGQPYDKVVADFVYKLVNTNAWNKAIVIGHNAGRFDHHLLIPAILRRGVKLNIIKKGNKIIQMNIVNTPDVPCNDLIFRDSYLYISQKLADLPKTFSFPGFKTYFPYTFCHEESYGVRLPCLPEKRFYGAKHMSPADSADFNRWYREHRYDTFDFDAILYEYGRNDVEVLHRGIVGYIKTSLFLAGWNPIVQSATFESFSFFQIKNKYVKEKMIGIIPEHGYYANQNASKLSNKFLQWTEHKMKIRLQSKLNGGEKQLVLDDGRTIRVDGYHRETDTVYEVLGDFWHGNPNVYKAETMNPILKKPMGDLFRETEDRMTRIVKKHNLKCVWELEIKEALARDPEMKRFFELVAHTSRLIAKDALAGGRTQYFWTYFKATGSYRIYMMDCVSMYPSVLMKTPLPVGQPIVVTENFEHIGLPLPYKGFYKLDVLAPKNLLHPVVWMRIEGRLIYALCKACAINEQKSRCEHTDDERAIHCTLYYNELTLALEEGYQIKKVYEVWHWTYFQDELFREFLAPYIKKKLEKSGLPRPEMTEDEIMDWIADLAEKNEGIKIDRNEVENNIQLRTLAKMAINSAWGKFIEKSVQSEVDFFNLSELVPKILDSDRHNVTDLIEMPGGKHMVTYEIKEDFAKAKPYTSMVYGAITTASGRVELYKILRKLQERCLYCDTDSVIFYGDPLVDDMLIVEEGDHLGGWKSELNPGEEILEFTSVAAKVYSYRKKDGKLSEVTKTRGVTIDKLASFDMNFDGIRKLAGDLVRGKVSKITTVRPTMYRNIGSIRTELQTKVTQPVMSKLLFDSHYRTKPYGWNGSVFRPIDLNSNLTVIQEEDGDEPWCSQQASVGKKFIGYI